MENPLLAKHWREMAEDIRAKSEAKHDGEPKRAMLKVAEGYENMAKRIEGTWRQSIFSARPLNSKRTPRRRIARRM